MIPRIKTPRPGGQLSATEFARMARAVQMHDRVQQASGADIGIGFYQNAGVVNYYSTLFQPFWAQITSGSSPYAWSEVVQDTAGTWITYTEGRSGTTTNNPAYEASGSTTVPANTRVVMWRGFGNTTAADYYLFIRPAWTGDNINLTCGNLQNVCIISGCSTCDLDIYADHANNKTLYLTGGGGVANSPGIQAESKYGDFKIIVGTGTSGNSADYTVTISQATGTNLTGGAITQTAGQGSTTNGAGGPNDQIGGAGTGTGAGGRGRIQGGAGGSSNGTGGAAEAICGAATGSGTGGPVTITGGASVNSTGGAVNITTTIPAGTGNSAAILVATGNVASGTAIGGIVTLRGGTGTIAGATNGYVDIYSGGTTAYDATQLRCDLDLTWSGGDALTAGNDGTNFTATCGDATVAGQQGGDMTLRAGRSLGDGNDGAYLKLYGGEPTASGAVEIVSGDQTGAGDAIGDITIDSGAGTSGGDIFVTPARFAEIYGNDYGTLGSAFGAVYIDAAGGKTVAIGTNDAARVLCGYLSLKQTTTADSSESSLWYDTLGDTPRYRDGAGNAEFPGPPAARLALALAYS